MDTKVFFETMIKDTEMQKKFSTSSTKEQFYDLAKENGLTDDFDTFLEAATAMAKENKMEMEEEDLDLESMTKVAGGVSDSAAYASFATGGF